MKSTSRVNGRFNSSREHVFVAQGKETSAAYYRMRWRVRIHFAYSLQCIRRNEASPRPRSFAQISYDRPSSLLFSSSFRNRPPLPPLIIHPATKRYVRDSGCDIHAVRMQQRRSWKLFSRRLAGSIGIFIGFNGDQRSVVLRTFEYFRFIYYYYVEEECCISRK